MRPVGLRRLATKHGVVRDTQVVHGFAQ
ncbi:ORFL198W [Human betaherpesvirus 5]|nr:ORFL198W [Human betaherpesvirus 5]QHX40546.1 ORFL198W [Human betaherpesvirus 5]